MDKILVLDFGGQYDQLIARRVREQHVYAKIVPYNKINIDEILKEEIGHVFAHVLEDCGVFKDTEEGTAHFLQFIASVKLK